ncbi:MAG: winged helix-turn-helix transcriptional regulator [Methanobrevibacter sp.]|jgi:predicted transcriptional regulator|uniref:winged helix-turn-helix domain-containing protein n=1 Tax=Methanobrevibacter sp. TaxID=66852 RepID=UPI0025FA2945|nr:winged helix-turn-helix domain-containing protein [Methanobrevibacter sp.]MBE6498868.1 winged helix-turn-helix transcriptional regulator [Methanobrevibacter sp.]
MKNKDDMSIVSLLARSKKRISVLKSLEKEDKIPSRISKDIDDNSNHVSKYLKTLKDAELVECLNEEDKRYRFYSITDKGKYYLDRVENNYKD